MIDAFIKLKKSKESDQLLSNPFCFALLAQVAMRAKRDDGFNINGLKIGESMIGDYKSIGLTRQKYRTVLKKLKTWGFLTIRSTNKGTIAKIVDMSVFDNNISYDNENNNHQTNQTLTIKQPSTNHQATTNKNKRSKEEEEVKEQTHVPIPPKIQEKEETPSVCMSKHPDPLGFNPSVENELEKTIVNAQARILFKDLYHNKWNREKRGRLSEALTSFNTHVNTSSIEELEKVKIAFDTYCETEQVERKIVMKVSTFFSLWENFLPKEHSNLRKVAA